MISQAQIARAIGSNDPDRLAAIDKFGFDRFSKAMSLLQQGVRERLDRNGFYSLPMSASNSGKSVADISVQTDAQKLDLTPASTRSDKQLAHLKQHLFPTCLGASPSDYHLKDNCLSQIHVGSKATTFTIFPLPDVDLTLYQANLGRLVTTIRDTLGNYCPRTTDTGELSDKQHDNITHPLPSFDHIHVRFTYNQTALSNEQRMTIRKELIKLLNDSGYSHVTRTVNQAVKQVSEEHPGSKGVIKEQFARLPKVGYTVLNSSMR